MNNRKYIGMDVHQASISIAVSDAAGKVLMESIIETKAATVLEFIQGLRGSLWVTFEEGTSAAWLYDLLKPHVTKVVVCDPRKNALLKAGNKNDRVDARKLSDLLRAGLLSFRASTRSFLLPAFSRAFFRGSHTTMCATCGFSRSYNHAALVPSSKATHKLPCSPWINSRMVAAFVSMMHSISSFPAASMTAMEVLIW